MRNFTRTASLQRAPAFDVKSRGRSGFIASSTEKGRYVTEWASRNVPEAFTFMDKIVACFRTHKCPYTSQRDEEQFRTIYSRRRRTRLRGRTTMPRDGRGGSILDWHFRRLSNFYNSRREEGKLCTKAESRKEFRTFGLNWFFQSFRTFISLDAKRSGEEEESLDIRLLVNWILNAKAMQISMFLRQFQRLNRSTFNHILLVIDGRGMEQL